MTKDKRASFLLSVAFVVVILALVYIGIKYVIIWLMPFIIGLIIAFLIRRPIRWLVKKTGISAKIISPVITLLFVLIVLTAIIFIIYQVINELGSFLTKLPAWYTAVVPGVSDKITSELSRLTRELPEEFTTALGTVFSNFGTYVQNGVEELSKSALNHVATAASNLPSLLITFVISIIAAFFMAGKTDVLKQGVMRQIPEKYKSMSSELYRTFGRSVVRLVKSYLFIMLMTFVELTIGLAIIRVDYIVVISAIIAVIDLLPVLGTGLVLVPWGIVELLIGDTFSGVGLLVLFAAVTVIRNIVEPKIVGRQIGLNPLVTLVCMYLGLRLFGILGLLLLPLLAILIKSANDMGVIKIWKKHVMSEGPAAEGAAAPGPDAAAPAQNGQPPKEDEDIPILKKLFVRRKEDIPVLKRIFIRRKKE